MELTVKTAVGLANLPDAVPIRTAVFMQEQGFENEFDAIDDRAVHIVIYADGIPAATGRLFQDKTGYHIGRVAVLKAYRKMHLGAEILQGLEEEGRRLGADQISLSAQVRVKGFYEKIGYHSQEDLHYDEGCPHVTMIKSL